VLNWFLTKVSCYFGSLGTALGATSSQTLTHFCILSLNAFRIKSMGNVLSAWIKTVPKAFGEGWTPFHWRYKQTHRFPNWSNVSCRSMRAWPRDFYVLDSSFLEKEVCVNNATTSVPALPSPFLKVPRTSFWTWPQTGLGTSLGFFLSSSVFRYVKM
jgi:hypothetical protein